MPQNDIGNNFSRTAIVPAYSPAHLVRLAALASEDFSREHEPRYAARASGCPINVCKTLPPVVLLLPERQVPEWFALSAFAAFGHQCEVTVEHDMVHVSVPPCQAEDVWRGWPIEHLAALGWRTQFQPPMPDGTESLSVCISPVQGRVGTPVAGLLRALVLVGVASRLQAVQDQELNCQMRDVEIQLVAHTLWVGRVPSDFQVDLLQRWWCDLAQPTRHVARTRLFSGPFLLPEAVSVGQLCDGSDQRILKRSGRLLISLHPLYSGGGNKEESKQWAMTKLASLMLSQGVELTSTTQFVDSFMAAVGAPKVISLMAEGSDLKRWEAVCELAKARDVPVPAATQGHAKAEARTKRAAAKVRMQQPRLRASDLRVEDGFFVNADGTPAVLLDALAPGVTGLLVIDPEQRHELVTTLKGVQADELALLVVGQNPDEAVPDSVPVSFPAQAGDPPTRVLIAGRLCNLGGRAIQAKHAIQAEVELQESMCCQFLMFQDEWEHDQWVQLTQAPVRFAADTFKQGGVQRPFSSPWARNFTLRGKPSAPIASDLATFHARIDKEDVDHVLKASGHNKIYLVPKTWSQQPHADYAVIWTGGHRADAVRAAMQTGDQCGLARNKNRYGVRVHESHHGRVFQLLNPGRAVPQRLAVTDMYKAGPFPLQAGAEDIRAWAAKLPWEVRVMKALGAAHWLIGTNHDPPGQYVAFNGQTVLLTPVRGREQQRPTVQSGILPRAAPAAAPVAAQVAEDPWVHNDPWKAYRKSAPATAAPRLSPVPPPGLSRAVAGPTDARFQEQDCRIGAIEASLKELRQQTEDRHHQLQLDRQEDRERSQAAVSELHGQMQSMSLEFSRQLQQSVESLQGAQAQQMQQVMTNFDELKSMLSCREREPSKKPRVGAE